MGRGTRWSLIRQRFNNSGSPLFTNSNKIMKNEKFLLWLCVITCVVGSFRALQLEDMAMLVLLILAAIISLGVLLMSKKLKL